MIRYQTLSDATAIDHHRVQVTFDDGQKAILDCQPYFSQSYWRKLNDPAFFKMAHVEYGHLTWPGDIDISPLEVWQDAERI